MPLFDPPEIEQEELANELHSFDLCLCNLFYYNEKTIASPIVTNSGGFPIDKREKRQLVLRLTTSLLLVAGTALLSQSRAISALICFAAIASSFLVIEMKTGPVALFPVLCWLSFAFGGTFPGILTALASISLGLLFHWKTVQIRFLFLSYLPVAVLFAATVSTGTELDSGSLLLIPAGILLQLLFFAGIRSISLQSMAMISTSWLINGIFACIIRFFLLENGFAGGLVILFVMLISLVYDFHSRSRLNLYTDRIKTLSLQNKLVSLLYSSDDSFPLFLMDGLHVWTMQGKPATIDVPEAPANTFEIEKRGKWLVVSTEKSVFIAGGDAAAELKLLGNADLQETLALLENVWKTSFSKRRLENAFLGAALLFVQLADNRDSDTHHHSVRVSHMAAKLAGILGLPESEILQLRVGALLHDIGKLAVPGSLIMKKGLLTRSERNVIETHPAAGAKLIGVIQRYDESAAIVLQHHEHIDGSGYPAGLNGSSISLYARIVAVADVFDAITSPRAYHLGKSDLSALHEIKRYKGTFFDANVVDALEELLE